VVHKFRCTFSIFRHLRNSLEIQASSAYSIARPTRAILIHLKFLLIHSFACYHLDSQTMTPTQAEVSCGNLGINFTNVLQADLPALVDLKIIRKINNFTDIFTHMGSAGVKAAFKTLMKLTPRWKIGIICN